MTSRFIIRGNPWGRVPNEFETAPCDTRTHMLVGGTVCALMVDELIHEVDAYEVNDGGPIVKRVVGRERFIARSPGLDGDADSLLEVLARGWLLPCEAGHCNA